MQDAGLCLQDAGNNTYPSGVSWQMALGSQSFRFLSEHSLYLKSCIFLSRKVLKIQGPNLQMRPGLSGSGDSSLYGALQRHLQG